MTRKVYSAKKNSKPEFTFKQEQELATLREFVAGLRELANSLTAEFPENKTAASKVTFEIEMASAEIAKLEIAKVKANLSRELPR